MNYFIVNAFTESMAGGNPAAVCITEKKLSESVMQKIASHFGLSETAFIENKRDDFNLRWFTPTTEVDLCGHATLAGAHILWEQDIVEPNSEIYFQTNSGGLSVSKKGELYLMDFPLETASDIKCPDELKKGLGAEFLYAGKNRFDYITEVESEDTLRNLVPDFEILMKLDTRGIIVTSVSDSGNYDFISRFFAPKVGIPEDPVTGSAHCCLAPYWSEKLGNHKLKGYQASKRGGTVYTELTDSRVLLGGKAVTFSSGKLID